MVKRLRLKPGDILVVRDPQTATRLSQHYGLVKFPVPIVVIPEKYKVKHNG